MKKVNFKFLMQEFGILLGCAFLVELVFSLPALASDLSRGTFSVSNLLLFLLIFTCFFFLVGMVPWFLGVHKFFTKKIAEKTMQEANLNGVSEKVVYYTVNGILRIDMESGKLAFVAYHNARELQLVSAAGISNIGVWWDKMPFNCTSRVLFQFQYQGKWWKIYTFVYRSNRRMGLPVDSQKVQKAIADANSYCAYIDQARKVALGEEVAQ